MNKEFDPYDFDYKTYITEMYRLTEMPAKLPRNSIFQMDDYATNNYEGIRIEKKCKLIKLFQNNYRVFYHRENGIDMFFLLDKNQPHICAEHYFKRITTPINGIENLHIWNSIRNRALIEMWFRDEIIPKEPVIISDKIQSDRGFNFWLGLFDDYAKSNNSHDMLIIEYNTGNIIKNITNKDEMKEFYGDNKFNFRFVLKKK